MNTVNPAEQRLWDEIEIAEEWVGLPKRKPNPLVKALKANLVLMEICLIAFAIGIALGYILSEESSSLMTPLIKEIQEEFSLGESNFQLAAKIFFNNLRATIIMVLGGTLLFVPLLIVMVNGFFAGFVLKVFLGRGYSLLEFIQVLFLHSIFELTAVFLSAAIGMRIGLAYILPRGGRVMSVSQRIKEAGVIYVAIVIPLLLLAAFIEAFISTALAP
jgi:stage II sporulation protein M